ncbi:AraC family transcriptional regulator [Paenibacillus sp. O199]|uniref:AraC family transcriptional regulator n=1 Tax=Paenibacillus sp. O199 TaxID=1643925 RepID=UPI0007BED666|nr:AraC family transcriptional regulator [Paenibacillus sp. O199]
MNIEQLFFHILYCNSRKPNELRTFSNKGVRTLQHHELIFITGGKAEITIESKRHTIQEGVLIYLQPDVPHLIEIDFKNPISFFSVHFSYVRIEQNDNTWTVNEDVEMFPLPAVQQLQDYYQLEEVFKHMVDTWHTKLPGYEFSTKSLLQQLLIAIGQNLKKRHRNYATSLKVEKIINYMNQHLHRKVTLTELSELVQLSAPYLSRAFKEITGYSIIEFFNKLKMDKAKEIILEGNNKVKEVAQVLGYTDEFYFSRLFKQLEGMSPTEFYSKNVHGV